MNSRRYSKFLAGLTTSLILFSLLISPALATAGDTTRVSVDSGGVEGNDESYSDSISADGRYVVFSSIASNLVTGDTNGSLDVFVRDTQTNVTTRISVNSGGVEGNSNSGYNFGSHGQYISADGRYVAFVSYASNLVAGDTNGSLDVFVRDTQANVTTRISVSSGGVEGNGDADSLSISADGRYVAFSSVASNLVVGDTNGESDVFVRDTQTNVTTRISVNSSGVEGNGGSYAPSISDGRYVAFSSVASNLVTGDTNGASDVFVRDTQANVTTRISVNSSGAEGNQGSYGPSISANGQYVAFSSPSCNLVTGDTNGRPDVFVRNTQANATKRISVNSSGAGGDWDSYGPSISADGRYVAFISEAANLVAGDTNDESDIFVRDTRANITTRVSVNSSGTEGNNISDAPSISADGRYVAFYSWASNLVVGDTNGVTDVFRHENQVGATTALITPLDGEDTHTNRPTFQWNPIPGAVNYQFQISLDDTFAKPVLKKTLKATVTSYVPAKNLLPNTTYYWRVAAKVGKTYGPWSETWSFTTGNPPPIPKLSAPGNKKTVTGSPTFIWKAVKPVTGVTFGHYEIQIATNAAFTVNLQSASTGTAIQYNGFILTPGIYYWRVRSVADNGDYSAWSAARMVTIQ